MGKSEDSRYYIVRGNWDPSSRGFKELVHLNEETPKGIFIFMSGLEVTCFFYGFVQISKKTATCYVIENDFFFFSFP
jgi:hypothetical protein